MNPSSVAVVSALLDNDLPQIADVVVDKGPDYVQEKLGVELQPNLSPEQIARLRDAAMKHEEFLVKADADSAQRATNMQLEVVDSADPEIRHFLYRFAWFWSIVSVIYFFAVTFLPIADANNTHFPDTILGFLLGTAASSIIQFFYGSSKSSQDKTKMLKPKE